MFAIFEDAEKKHVSEKNKTPKNKDTLPKTAFDWMCMLPNKKCIPLNDAGFEIIFMFDFCFFKEYICCF